MPVIYIVNQGIGEFSDRSVRPVIAMRTKERAEEKKAELEARVVLGERLFKKVRELEKKDEQENPAPVCPPSKPVPKWRSGLRKEEITEEMRAERRRIEQENEAMYESHSILWNIWFERQKQIVKKFVQEYEQIDPVAVEYYHQFEGRWSRPEDYFITEVYLEGEPE